MSNFLTLPYCLILCWAEQREAFLKHAAALLVESQALSGIRRSWKATQPHPVTFTSQQHGTLVCLQVLVTSNLAPWATSAWESKMREHGLEVKKKWGFYCYIKESSFIHLSAGKRSTKEGWSMLMREEWTGLTVMDLLRKLDSSHFPGWCPIQLHNFVMIAYGGGGGWGFFWATVHHMIHTHLACSSGLYWLATVSTSF